MFSLRQVTSFSISQRVSQSQNLKLPNRGAANIGSAQLGHWLCPEQADARFGDLAGEEIRPLSPRTVTRNTGVRIHLTVELRDENKR